MLTIFPQLLLGAAINDIIVLLCNGGNEIKITNIKVSIWMETLFHYNAHTISVSVTARAQCQRQTLIINLSSMLISQGLCIYI